MSGLTPSRSLSAALLIALVFGLLAKAATAAQTTASVTLTIVAALDCDYIVSQPGGGESWMEGLTYSVNWSSTGTDCGSTVNLELYDAGVFVQAIATGANDTTYAWTIPGSVPAGFEYRVRVIDSTTPSYYGESGSDFIINATSCNVNIVSGTVETGHYEACDLLILGPSFIVEAGSSVTVSSGNDVILVPSATVEEDAIFDVENCGQSLCEISANPMPYGCHSCVSQICDVDPDCCSVGFNQQCVDQVNSVCGLICD